MPYSGILPRKRPNVGVFVCLVEEPLVTRANETTMAMVLLWWTVDAGTLQATHKPVVFEIN